MAVPAGITMGGVAHPSGVMPPGASNDVVPVYPGRPAAARYAANQEALCYLLANAEAEAGSLRKKGDPDA